ncbi:hypothetical protein MPER_01574, partial [Moniliophthora perniciosa FA553]
VILEGQKQPLWTFAIVTTAANKEFSWLHDRQPVILSTPEALQKWLDTSSQSWTTELGKLVLQPYHESAAPLECYQVPKEVGKVGTESPSFILPVAQRKDGIQAMFSKQSSQPKASPASKVSSGKRKRSPSPSPPQEVELVDSEDDDEVQIIDAPESSAPKKVKKEPDSPSMKQKSKSPAKPKARWNAYAGRTSLTYDILVLSKNNHLPKARYTSFFSTKILSSLNELLPSTEYHLGVKR